MKIIAELEETEDFNNCEGCIFKNCIGTCPKENLTVECHIIYEMKSYEVISED